MNYKKFSSYDQYINLHFPVEEKLYEKISDNEGESEPISVEVYKLKNLGKCLVIQDDIQLIESHEYKYHEMFVHVPMSMLSQPKNILILGGGDGGACREILKYDSVEKVKIIELSRDVVEACKEHLPSLSERLDDPKVEIIYDNACKWISKTKEKFDFILIDATDFCSTKDKDSEKYNLRDELNIEKCKSILSPSGIIIYNDDFVGIKERSCLNRMIYLSDKFEYVRPFKTNIPYFLGGDYSFMMCSDGVDLFNPIIDWDRTKIKTKYFNKKLFNACFAMGESFEKETPRKKITRKLGESFCLDLGGCDSEEINNLEKIKKVMKKALKSCGFKILNESSHKFQPQGITICFLLSESHFTCHSWPKSERICFDLFSCAGYQKSKKLLDSICNEISFLSKSVSNTERKV
jgi:spermidine synthase